MKTFELQQIFKIVPIPSYSCRYLLTKESKFSSTKRDSDERMIRRQAIDCKTFALVVYFWFFKCLLYFVIVEIMKGVLKFSRSSAEKCHCNRDKLRIITQIYFFFVSSWRRILRALQHFGC